MPSSLQIVHVDDNRQALELTAMACQEVDPAIAYCGFDAADASLAFLAGEASEHPVPPPHLLLLDVSMPGMTGIELLDRIAGDPRLNQLPVVMLTSSNRPDDRSAALSRGARRYLVKPDSFTDLIALVRELSSWAKAGAP